MRRYQRVVLKFGNRTECSEACHTYISDAAVYQEGEVKAQKDAEEGVVRLGYVTLDGIPQVATTFMLVPVGLTIPGTFTPIQPVYLRGMNYMLCKEAKY